jgi:hypothetical protein
MPLYLVDGYFAEIPRGHRLTLAYIRARPSVATRRDLCVAEQPFPTASTEERLAAARHYRDTYM